MSSFFFAARLAWRQLIHDKSKLIAATLGVLFACVLVFMQLGFKDSLETSVGTAPSRMNGDIFLMHKQTEALWRSVQFNRSVLMRALGNPEVEAVYPMYVSLGQFKNMDTRTKRTLMIYGFNPDADMMSIPEVSSQRDKLKLKDTVLFDRTSRPEFGNVAEQIAENRRVTEINDYKVSVAGTFLMGTSFSADGNLVTSDLNFHRIFPNRTPDQVDLGFIIVRDKTRIPQVVEDMKALVGDEVLVLTYDQLVQYEKDYWNNTAPVGFIFGMGVVMGLVVGMVIVYQILFTDITNNLSQYATLKAMGYTQSYLKKVVFASAVFLAILGYIPGLGVALFLYDIAEKNIYIPFPMPPEKMITVFCFILIMCFGAGLLAIRKLKAANPADMF